MEVLAVSFSPRGIAWLNDAKSKGIDLFGLINKAYKEQMLLLMLDNVL